MGSERHRSTEALFRDEFVRKFQRIAMRAAPF